MVTLVLGGQSSGKSDFALSLLDAAPGRRVMVATGLAADQDFRARIMAHKRGREAALPVVEARADLPAVLGGLLPDHDAVLVDALDFWLYSCMMQGEEEARLSELEQVLGAAGGKVVVLVSQEAGLCPVAGDAATRAFIRAQGTCNKRLAALADAVWLVAAGLPLQLKG
ncbi:cobalbumin biosynthesis protein [Desulfovibrio sp. X2]|uniref:bifunctional adenosylcobinamide kinase/adenosylcobinamide-phosphate guanylyltransferase n=1 Tax=Desulfovibrio sp. X2 TaxID=941449 RepID=UPI0003588C54|nr:bifunctional adenosylcobinamide kinase/adenosylcobinamide-phosphate guanylyltransferase [Desulfovibrio sp. X2]EPR43724.1 cobalbumin biosynthesis protein [Desulfovibrio sp. X2]